MMETRPPPTPERRSPAERSLRLRRPRSAYGKGGNTLLAQGEPLVWLAGGGLMTCLLMITGLLLLVIYQGLASFWPAPLVRVATVADAVHLGEVTRVDHFRLDFGTLAMMSGPTAEAAGELLHPLLRHEFDELLARGRLAPELRRWRESIERQLLVQAAQLPAAREAPGHVRQEWLERIVGRISAAQETFEARLADDLRTAVDADPQGRAVAEYWRAARDAEFSWHAAESLDELNDLLTDDALYLAWAQRGLILLAGDISTPMRRRQFRTGNFELTGEHFNWVSDFEIAPDGETRPEWAVLFERLSWGRFYGEPQALLVDGEAIATTPAEAWAALQRLHPEVRERWRQRRQLEIVDTGRVNHELERERLQLRRIELRHGLHSPAHQQAEAALLSREEQLHAQYAEIRGEINRLDEENERYQLAVVTGRGEQVSLPLAEIVRAFPANQLSGRERLSIYLARWGEFLTDDPREANSEGGVFPAIFGTVVMTVLMSIGVAPFGVLAALYLREYAKGGLIVSMVRIAINNLAGVPSIVFGVFGLGFFCYFIGGTIDQVFFPERLPSPTFGSGCVLWASLTLALLTLPVVIVATEEALAAVPRSMREGSLACGATKFQTIWRIVLPRALPGIMTGMILAMARGAGEVAPLMLVGAVKLAPELPIDWEFPFGLNRSFMHLGFHIYDLGFQSQNSEAAKPMVFTTTLLLIGLIAVLNLFAMWLRARLRRKYQAGQF